MLRGLFSRKKDLSNKDSQMNIESKILQKESVDEYDTNKKNTNITKSSNNVEDQPSRDQDIYNNIKRKAKEIFSYQRIEDCGINLSSNDGKERTLIKGVMELYSEFGKEVLLKDIIISAIYKIVMESNLESTVRNKVFIQDVIEDILYIPYIHYTSFDGENLYETQGVFYQRFIIIKTPKYLKRIELSYDNMDEIIAFQWGYLYSIDIEGSEIFCDKKYMIQVINHLKKNTEGGANLIDKYKEENILEEVTVEKDKTEQSNLKEIKKTIDNANHKKLKGENSLGESFKETKELEAYIRQLLNNVAFPSLLFLPYFNAELLQVWLADTQGINFRQSEDIDDFYKNDFKPFILYLKNKGIIVDGFENKFLVILTSTMDDIVREGLHDEYFEMLDKEETLESCILKYLEISNFDEELYDRIIHMRYLRMFLSIKNYTGEVFKKSMAGIDQLTKIMEEIFENYKFELKMNRFESKIENTKEFNPTIEYVDLMDGQEFEMFLMDLFQNLGYKSEMTKQTGGQGVYLLIYKNNQSIAVQAKRHSTTVGNFAIQQVVAGQHYYNTDKTMVVTNNYFTKSCIELAQSTNTILWDRDKLNAMMDLIY